ncbi:VOC family protein [Polymorphum gilvum]|uniref:VOC domain-containing protein n=1 Tax=Polymorphum gilvum (strain LMG 25793 / CGMCC 1.9160 / SL003B-26A1) TaxID=991905 RepID=F2IYZ9_POLGS|nr:VOC family protein [Polymorphum gilvum]ADZ70614.1 hypothetical protein SL003B_2189 [Polymorphum gilvum SL003B-26A1]
MSRGLDHVVVAVRDLEAAAAVWQALGFTLTPKARHPFGTANRLIQLDGAFIELLAVEDAASIADPAPGAFSFAAFNRDFLAARVGASMLVVDSTDPAADRAAFAAAGLPVFEPFAFERTAAAPDGGSARVGFDLTFTADPQAPGIGFFTCRNRYPENFWKADYQRHANGARRLADVVLVAEDPADHHIFLEAFAGRRELRATSLGIEVETARGWISIFTPVGFRLMFGDAAADALPARLPAISAIAVEGDEGTERQVVPGSELFGVTLVLDGTGRVRAGR